MVVGLDGLSLEVFETLTSEGHMPYLLELKKRGDIKPIRSVLPTVSPVAWASYLAGSNPGRHGIFGFVDRKPAPFELFITNGSHLRHETLFETLSRRGLRVAAVGVPMTYPPRPINGVVVGCFLSPSLEKGVYPKSVYGIVKDAGYKVDVDPGKALEDLSLFLTEAEESLDARFRLCLRLLVEGPWDLFQIHVMETDRVNHFLLSRWSGNEQPWKDRFCSFYKRLDQWIGRILEDLIEDLERGEFSFVVLADHGICPTVAEIQLNQWLETNGYLKFKQGHPLDLRFMDSGTKAYSLIPGRIYVNLKGREAMGVVRPGKDYEALRDEIVTAIKDLSDPETGGPVIEEAYRGEELYSGPFVNRGPDIVVKPTKGYDLKAALGCHSLVTRSHVTGTHTFEGAFFLQIPGARGSGVCGIEDAAGEIMRILGVSPEG